MLSKTDLRNAIASKNRGITATLADRQAIASIIARVEDHNPTPDPLSATDLLAGDWRLLYTTVAALKYKRYQQSPHSFTKAVKPFPAVSSSKQDQLLVVLFILQKVHGTF